MGGIPRKWDTHRQQDPRSAAGADCCGIDERPGLPVSPSVSHGRGMLLAGCGWLTSDPQP